jgi:hypothetical protein
VRQPELPPGRDFKPTVSPDAPLLPAGLLGPVTIQAMQVVHLKPVDPLKAQQTN